MIPSHNVKSKRVEVIRNWSQILRYKFGLELTEAELFEFEFGFNVTKFWFNRNLSKIYEDAKIAAKFQVKVILSKFGQLIWLPLLFTH